MENRNSPRDGVEWPTVLLIVVSYGALVSAVMWLPLLSQWLAFVVATLAITLHSSLQHETIHGHPLPQRWLSVALVALPVGLLVPYERFRDQHLAHHRDTSLTDPYDDPESGYFDPAVWHRLSRPMQLLLEFNNTLAGRLIVGPVLSQVHFVICDLRNGDRAILMVWLRHLAGIALVLWLVARFGAMPVWLYLLAAYCGMSMLKIRTYLEHQAHEAEDGRTVIIEDRGLLSLLFLNNNYHAVHHAHPDVSWYDLPARFEARRDMYLKRNHGYYYKSYLQILRAYLFQAKEPVPHPLMDADKGK